MSLSEFISNLFSSSSESADDVIEKALEENAKKEQQKEQENYENSLVTDLSINKDDWKYEFEPNEAKTLAGNEVRTDDPDGQAYAGAYVREMIESREESPEAYTRFGYTKHPVRGVESVGIPHNELFKHIAVFGVTGFGKSTVMKNMMIQWVFAGYGICFIDPKGDDSWSLLKMIPERRTDDVVWVQPGNRDREKAVAFNFFDTHSDPGDSRHETEVEEIRSDFVSILKEELSGWGAIIESVSRAISKQLIQADENYNPVDMYKILNNEDEREAFAEMYGNEIEQQYLQRISQMEQEELESLNRRLREWAETDTTREIIGHEKSEINLSEVVEEGKILLVDTSSLGDEKVRKLVTTAIIRRIWATIRARSDIPKDEREPFFLCIDEFDKVANDENDIENILSKGRSLGICTFLANQQPNQLPDSIRDAVYSNCANLFSFNPGAANYKDAKTLSKTLGDVEAHQLMSLGSFNLLGRLTINDAKTDAIEINTFPEYPPVRNEQQAEELVQQSIEKYGVDREVSTDFSDYGVLRFSRGEGSEDEVGVSDDDSISRSQILESVYSAKYKYETKDFKGHSDWVKDKYLKQELEKYVEDVGYDTAVDNISEKISDSVLDKVLEDSVYFRVTNKGLDEIFGQQDSGDSASGGKIAHRELLKAGHRVFSALGYNTRIPQQKGEAAPDGLATPPIDPVGSSESMEEAEELRNKLKQRHPRLWELFQDSEIHLEAESTTIKKPKQTIKNLTKALEKGRHCAFIVKDGRATEDDSNKEFEHWAEKGENIFKNPPFVSRMDDKGHRKFYNMNSVMKLKDGKSRALMKVDTDGKNKTKTIWHEYGKHIDNVSTKIVLKNSQGDVIAQFDDASDLRQPSTTKFNYHYYRDRSKGLTIVEDSNGNVVDEYDSVGDMEKDGYQKVKRPLIPEEYLPGGQLPDQSNWTFVIIPKPDSERGPQIYENGKLTPLFTNHSKDGSEVVSEVIDENENSEDTQSEQRQDENGQEKRTDEESNPDEKSTHAEAREKPANSDSNEEPDEQVRDSKDRQSKQRNQSSQETQPQETQSEKTNPGRHNKSDKSQSSTSDTGEASHTRETGSPKYEQVSVEDDRALSHDNSHELPSIDVEIDMSGYKSESSVISDGGDTKSSGEESIQERKETKRGIDSDGENNDKDGRESKRKPSTSQQSTQQDTEYNKDNTEESSGEDITVGSNEVNDKQDDRDSGVSDEEQEDDDDESLTIDRFGT